MTICGATSRLSPNDGFLFHEVFPGEKEFFKPLRGATNDTATVRNEKWRLNGRTFTLAITGLHGKSQCERLRKIWQQPPEFRPRGVAMVELCMQWDANYCHNHGGHCLETLGWATHVLAPDPIAATLRLGILRSPKDYAKYLSDLNNELQKRHKAVPRYRENAPTDKDINTRRRDIECLLHHLNSAECIWSEKRIISSGVPSLETRYFDGARLRPPKSEAHLPPSIVWIDQGHYHEVREAVKQAACKKLVFEPFKRAQTDDEIERGRALLCSATIIVTEFSNLAYQAALHGKRVLYCTWRAKTRPLPLLLNDSGDKRFKEHVREAKNEEDVHKAINDAVNGVWREAERVETTPADEIVQRIREAVMPQSAA